MGNQITVFMSIKGHKLRLGHGVIAYLDRVIVVRLRTLLTTLLAVRVESSVIVILVWGRHLGEILV